MKKIFIALLIMSSLTVFAEEVTCTDELTQPPYCVGVSYAEDYCAKFGNYGTIRERSKETFNEKVSEGQNSVDASA
ncbi:MAG: hypothetical protein HON90_08715, partial [Halobacteriovoraceae bacterium]|nr:hypothetical protein [Halobacteriovoraceae bacterium]